jgi:hypothetical protein
MRPKLSKIASAKDPRGKLSYDHASHRTIADTITELVMSNSKTKNPLPRPFNLLDKNS